MKFETVNIMGINPHVITKEQAKSTINEMLAESRPHLITTPNPEIILKCGKDEELFFIVNDANLAIPDGIGLKFASWLVGENLKRISGTDIVDFVLSTASRSVKKIAVLNMKGGLSDRGRIESALAEKYSGLRIKAWDIERDEMNFDYADICAYAPEILLVSLGSPIQEKLAFHAQKKIPSLRLAIPCGGALDYLTGNVKRAPSILRTMGLEWLYRLLFHKTTGQGRKKRAMRIFRAVILFPLLFLRWRYILPLFYRPNVACLLYKKSGNEYYIFIVERTDQRGHWQFPQGGTDGEGIREAGMRELREEAGTDKFFFKDVFKNVWRYDFNKETGRYKARRNNGYRGQKQSLLIAEFTGQDNDIKINFWDHSRWQWAKAEKVQDLIYRDRMQAAKVFMDCFWKTLDKQR
jgi:N-acetylglucosaminyldiphosphoundecaprenol N-acetyl-beta-D-mannosaminyltransferase